MTVDTARSPAWLDPFYPLVGSIAALQTVLTAGARLVQLRVKNEPQPFRLPMIERARDLCAQSGCELVINDHWREAIAAGCRFVHLGQEDLDDADLSALRKASVRVGISTHDEAELRRALTCDPAYVALGPIFATSSKPLSWHAQGLERIGQWRSRIGDIPLVAIGGISLAHARQVLDAGADSIAVIGDVANHDNPGLRAEQWLAATR